MLEVTEAAGDTLDGAVDGANRMFATTFPFAVGTVLAFVGGVGVALVERPPQVIELAAAPAPGQAVEVSYRSPVTRAGGALGGVPAAPEASALEPAVLAGELLPVIIAAEAS